MSAIPTHAGLHHFEYAECLPGSSQCQVRKPIAQHRRSVAANGIVIQLRNRNRPSERKRPALDETFNSRMMASSGPFRCQNYYRCKGWVRSAGELCPQCVSSLARILHAFVRLRHSLMVRSNGKTSKSRDDRRKLPTIYPLI